MNVFFVFLWPEQRYDLGLGLCDYEQVCLFLHTFRSPQSIFLHLKRTLCVPSAAVLSWGDGNTWFIYFDHFFIHPAAPQTLINTLYVSCCLGVFYFLLLNSTWVRPWCFVFTADFSPHETLLHFAARRGLRRVALFLLQQPGGPDALQLANKHGHTPARVAQSRGHTQLQHLLSEWVHYTHTRTRLTFLQNTRL